MNMTATDNQKKHHRLKPLPMCGSSIVANDHFSDPVGDSPLDQTCPQTDLVVLLRCVRKKAANAMGLAELKLSPGRKIPDLKKSPSAAWVDKYAQRFNDVFMAIQGYTSLLARRYDASHLFSQRLQRIEGLVDAESVLTNDLLFNLIRAQSDRNDSLERFLHAEICTVAGYRFACLDHRLSNAVIAECTASVMIRILGEVAEHTLSMLKEAEADRYAADRLKQILSYVDAGLNSIQTALADEALSY